MAMDWDKQEGKVLLIGDVNKYPNWSREFKLIDDGILTLKVIFSISFGLEIYRGVSHLSRRVISYSLQGLSFREHLDFSGIGSFDSFSFEDTLVNVIAKSLWILIM